MKEIYEACRSTEFLYRCYVHILVTSLVLQSAILIRMLSRGMIRCMQT